LATVATGGLSIALLGAPVVTVDGRPLDVDTRKATALLAYLAVTGRPARRDTLAGLLWPETNPDRARSALRRTLSTLRTALGGRWLETDRDLVSLGAEDAVTDIAEFRRLLAECATHGHAAAETCRRCVEPLSAAAALHRGPFLAGFGLRDSVEFDDWEQLTADELRRELSGVLDLLVDTLTSTADTAQAIATARRRLALDPLHEPAHRQLIRAYVLGGDRSAALEQYRDCVRVLDRELGVRPLDETTALYHAVLEGTYAPAPTAPAVAPPPDPERGYALVGRDREVSALSDAYRAVGPDGKLVVLVGEAGIGKTRLGEKLLADVAAGGGTALGVRCFQEEAELAYGVVLELVRNALSACEPPTGEPWWLTEASRLLPELGPAPTGTVDSVAAQARFYEAICELLLHALGESPAGAVFLDDAHWADEASLGLLRYLAHRLRGRPLLLAVSWRPEEVPAEHPIRRLLEDSRRDPAARVLTLGRLTPTDVAELVGSTGRDGGLGARLYKESGGLPFFVVEYLDALARDGADTTDWPLPGGVRDLLGARLSTLGGLATQVVAAAAVLGRSFDADTLRGASGRGAEEVVRSLEELVARGVLVEGADGTLDFRHEQARDLVYEEMTLARRRLLHRRVAVALGTRGRRETQAAVIAHHLTLAGDDAEAAELYRVAGDRARALYANAEALSHYRAALALGNPEQSELHVAVGDLQTLAGDYRTALASYETAAALASPGLAPGIEHRLGVLHLRRGDWELADASLVAALAGSRGEAAARVTADRSLVAHRRGQPEEAGRLAAAALDLAEQADDSRARAQARNILGILAASRGEYATAVVDLEASLALAESAGDVDARAAALNNLALSVVAAGDTQRAIELTEAGIDLTVTRGDRHREAALRNNLADLLQAAGRREESMAQLKVAVAIFAEVGEEGKLEPEIWKLSEW
jgi:DNA-binding SARP family transcriptional activator